LLVGTDSGETVAELYAFARTPETILSAARLVEACGKRPR
jgi:hypothetical protein